MKRYRKKKIGKTVEISSEPVPEPTPEVPRIDDLNGDYLFCPRCGHQGEILIKAREHNYYRVAELRRGDNWGPYADWGDHLDGETDESWLMCDQCNADLMEEDVFEFTLTKMAEGAQDEAV